MKRLLLPLIALLACVAVAGPVVAATQTETVHQHQETESFTDTICAGGPLYDITTTYNGVFHTTVTDSGFHVTFTQTGKFTAVDPVTDEVIQGHFTIWGGFNENPGGAVNGTFTFNAHGRGDMGTRVNAHVVEHINATPDGTVNEFFRAHCK